MNIDLQTAGMQTIKDYIDLVRFRMKLYFWLTVLFLITTIVFLAMWLDMVNFVNGLK